MTVSGCRVKFVRGSEPGRDADAPAGRQSGVALPVAGRERRRHPHGHAPHRLRRPTRAAARRAAPATAAPSPRRRRSPLILFLSSFLSFFFLSDHFLGLGPLCADFTFFFAAHSVDIFGDISLSERRTSWRSSHHFLRDPRFFFPDFRIFSRVYHVDF